MADAFSSFLSALTVLEKHDVCYEILEAFDTLLVYCYNLYSRPEETKFHFISAVNIHFQERLGHLNGSVAAMDAIGYRQVNSVYQYDQVLLSPENLPRTKETLSRMIQHLEERRTVVSSHVSSFTLVYELFNLFSPLSLVILLCLVPHHVLEWRISHSAKSPVLFR